MKKTIGLLVVSVLAGSGLAYAHCGHCPWSKSNAAPAKSQAAAVCCSWSGVSAACDSLKLDEKRNAEVKAILAKYEKEDCTMAACKMCREEMQKILSAEEMSKVDAAAGWCEKK